MVLPCDQLGIAYPCGNYVEEEFFGQFRLPGASEVLEQTQPRFQSGFADGPLSAASGDLRFAATSGDDVLGSRLRLIERFLQAGEQPREHRHQPGFSTGTVFHPGAVHDDLAGRFCQAPMNSHGICLVRGDWSTTRYGFPGSGLENVEWGVYSRTVRRAGNRSPLRSGPVWMVVMWIRGAKSNV